MTSPIPYYSPARCASALLAAFLVFPAIASADVTKEQCIDANTKAQSALRAHQLGEARTLLQSCLDPHCPALVRVDCSRRLDEVDRIQPTIIFDAKDQAGNDLSAVTVSLEGHVLTDRLDGAELAVDPGSHEFVFQVAGGQTVKQSFVLKEFQKARRELVVVSVGAESLTPAPPKLDVPRPAKSAAREGDRLSAATAAAAAAAAPTAVERPVPSAAYVLGGLAAAGFLDFAIAGTLGNNLKSELQTSGCAPFCDRDKADAMRARYLVGDLGLAVGVASLVGTAVVFLTRPSQLMGAAEPRARASGLWIAAPLPTGGVIGWRTSF